jgi:Glycosyltransferase
MRILFVEIQQAVHSVGYVNSLLLHAPQETNVEVAVALPDRHEYLGDLLKSLPFPPEVRKFTLPGWTSRLPGRLGGYWIAFKALLHLRKIIKEWKPDRVAFLRIDFVFLWLALPIRKWIFGSCEISGIYFGGGEFRPNLQTRLKQRIRHFLTRSIIRHALRQKTLRTAFCLDHSLPKKVSALAGFHAEKLQASADPWLPFPHLEPAAALKALALDLRPPVVLSLGVQSRRKGTCQLLESLAHLKPGSFSVLIAGPLRSDVSESVKNLIEQRRSEGWQITVVDRFIADEETWTFLQAATIVVCPYVDFYQSSNVMIRACAAGRPVLVSKGGVMEDAVKTHHCGIAAEPVPAEIAAGIRDLFAKLHEDPQTFSHGCESYASLHSSERFFRQFL